MKHLKAVDFFCSGGGMSYGMQQAGIEVIAGIDIDKACQATYEANIKNSKFIHKDVCALQSSDLNKYVKLDKNDNNMIFIGCSPCQYWSIMRTNKIKASASKNLLCEFLRFIQYYNPGHVVVENVPGILKKAEESKLGLFIQGLEKQGYEVFYKLVDLNNYGVPQSRKRFTLLANRVGNKVFFPKPQHTKPTVRTTIGNYKIFPKIPAGHIDKTSFIHSTAGLTKINIERLKMTVMDGGGRSAWENTDMQLQAYKKNNVGFKDTYGRMSWNKPAPTITTKFFSISNGRFAHPEQTRAISLREGATLQTFPLDYQFVGTSIAAIAKVIGNAVPPNYAKKIGESIGDSYVE